MRTAALMTLLLGCAPIESGLATVVCEQYVAATHAVPATWPCWVLGGAGECVFTSRADVGACSVPPASDELFAGGDEVAEWCGVLEGQDEHRHFVPVDCGTGIALAELQHGVPPEEQQ